MDRKILPRSDWVVSRERIDAMLDAGMAYPFVTVVAGPGYGKSTAILDYARRTSRKLCWHHLLTVDNDPDCFWDRAIGAFRHELPELAKAMEKGKFPETYGEFHRFLKKLTEILFRGEELLLVYDSVENITNEKINLFFEILIRAELENLYIIYISNVRPHKRYMVGDGNHLQIGPAELQFTRDETMELFKKCGRQISNEECTRLLDLTGGWPLVLYLMASHPSNKAHHAFGETPHFHVMAELFQENYFIEYEQEFRQLLVKLSFFDGVPLGLIQTIGNGDVIQTVDQMTRNIFISYDYSQSRFYFQKMYHDFLSQKRAMLSDEERMETYSKAGSWLYSNGLYLEALFCYWEIRDYDRYMEAMVRMPQKRRSKRNANMVLEHLNMIPEEYARTHETVDLHRGLLYMNDLEIGRAKEIFIALAGRLEAEDMQPEKRIILGDVYTALVEISIIQNTLDGLEYIRKAHSLVPEGGRIRSGNSMVVGNTDVFFLPDNNPGRLEAMFEYIDGFSEPSKGLYGKSGHGFIHLFTAEAYYFSERGGDVQENSTKAILRAEEADQHDIVLNALFLQMRLALFQGDYDTARAIVQKISEYTDQAGSTELYPIRDCALGFFYISMGDIAKVPLWLSRGEALPTGIPMDTGRDRLICALSRYIEGRYEDAYLAILDLDGILQEHRQWGLQITGHILKAACLHRLENRQKAVQELWEAYNMTWQNKVIICFAEFGRTMEILLELVQSQNELEFDSQWIKDVYAASSAYARRISAMQKLHKREVIVHNKHPDDLTPREREVLRYLSDGLTREEMSGILGISLHGVKKHITNIYDKLGAINRVEAINIATANGILE